MFWTGLYFLVLIGVACWYAFDYLFSSGKKEFATAYCEPSNANIDQYLPNEIIENVFTFLDCQSVLHCRSVSKYWKFQASKENVLKEVLTNQRASNRQKFCQLLGETEIEVKWLECDKNNSLRDQLRDHMFAAQRGATLVELSGDTIEGLKLAGIEREDWTKDYLVKAIGIHSFTELHFSLGYSLFVAFTAKNRPEIKPRYKDQFELIFNLNNFLRRQSNRVELPELLWYKHRNDFPLIAGFLPTSWNSPLIFLNYLIPCLFHDLLYSSWTTRAWIAVVTHIISTLFVGIVLFRTAIDRIRTKAVICAAIHCFILPLFIFNYYYHFSLFKGGIIAAAGLYILQDIQWQERIVKREHFNIIEATVLLLYMMIFDWRLIFNKFMDGSMWKVIFINALCYIVICWEIMWVNFFHLYAATRRPENDGFFKILLKWDRKTVRGLVKLSSMIVVISFYYPVTVI